MDCSAEIVNWNGTNQWDQYDSIFVCSTWDIPKDPQKFLDWLDKRERLINDKAVLIDNVIKSRYLSHLIQIIGEDYLKGNAITPSLFYSRKGNPVDNIKATGGSSLDDLLGERDNSPLWQGKPVVIKPVISADGIDTCIYNRNNIPIQLMKDQQHLLQGPEAQQHFDRLLDRADLRGVILQPYLSGVEQGEYSLIFLAGKFSHAIQKPNGFRQDDSTKRVPVSLASLPTGMIDFCHLLLKVMSQKYRKGSLTRVRVDLFQQGDHFVLCELECTEPNMNLQRFSSKEQDSLFQEYASAIKNRTLEL
ncbi:MAG: hypothetical protein BGO52_00430 [Sphingobacteriales bacterium 44-61]|nr:MAG: hypothetical protein BGO52_00430 [Sphingobacteriales bacterium 44-61]